MNTEKKNQHYIPKFYLRNFSFQSNKNQIGVFNPKSKVFVEKAKLKTQGSKNFFYGYDGIIENGLSEIEGILARVIKGIVESESLPEKGSDSHNVLLAFVVLTHLRNPVMIESIKNSNVAMKKWIVDDFPTVDASKLVGDINHEESIVMALSTLSRLVDMMLDLDCKILINNTPNPFICSDFPIVKYNQFLEERKWAHGKTGYGSTGLQIFIPLNHKITIVFYDSMIYKVGFKKRQTCEINDSGDIDSLNVLQFLNCYDSIFFDEKASAVYIKQLYSRSLKYKKANQTRSKTSFMISNEEDRKQIEKTGKQNLIILGNTDCETKLKIGGINMISGTKYVKLHPSVAQLRPWPTSLRKKTAANIS